MFTATTYSIYLLYNNFLALTQTEITHQKTNSVVKHLTEHPSELNNLKHCLLENAKVMQYLYATLFPRYYFRNNKFGIQSKSLVDLAYKEWISKKSNLNKSL